MNIPLPTLVQLAQFVAGIAVLIILHEVGHFVVSKLLKVEVEEFGIGFPPRLMKLFEIGGTKFTLNWLPLGGFVRPKGENDPTIPGGLAAARPWVRLAVLIAGPATNLLAGVVLGALLFYSLGEPVLGQVLVQEVVSGSPAEKAGLAPGDLILAVDGEKIESVEQLQQAINDRLGVETQITYKRGAAVHEISLVPRNPPPPDQGAIGITMGYPVVPTTWSRAIPNGFVASYEYIRSVLLLPLRIFQGEVSPEEGRLVGYKGMFDLYQRLPPLWFFMVISLSLGLFNLFPIPALDGGRIFLTLPEILLGRRVPPQFENMIHLVGFTLLLLLLIYINVQDFINPVRIP